MAGHDIIRVLGQIALAVLASTPAVASDVPGMTCAEIGSFAERVAQQKAEGVSFDDTVRRLRRSLAPEYAPTAPELEKIVRAIYGMAIFSTASPEEVGIAYQTACEIK